jgi:thioredoxin 2
MILRCKQCGSANRVPAARLHENAKCGSCKNPLPTDEPLPVHSAVDFDELVAGAKVPVLVDFWAQWCGPCHAVAPQVALLAKKKHGTLIVAKVDTEELQNVAGRYDIRSIPTMILFSEGKEAKRISGAMPADAIAQSVGV